MPGRSGDDAEPGSGWLLTRSSGLACRQGRNARRMARSPRVLFASRRPHQLHRRQRPNRRPRPLRVRLPRGRHRRLQRLPHRPPVHPITIGQFPDRRSTRWSFLICPAPRPRSPPSTTAAACCPVASVSHLWDWGVRHVPGTGHARSRRATGLSRTQVKAAVLARLAPGRARRDTLPI